MKTGLVLEGGGMRGLYTIGVLDALMENNIHVDYVIGVSAGACNGASYVSGQKGRSYRINMKYITDKRYCSFSNYIKSKSFFGLDFVFDEIPHKLDLFDYDFFLKSKCEFKVGVTDVTTGKTVYYSKDSLNRDCTVLKASCAIPMFSPMIEYGDGLYLDGGTSDPIPVAKAIEDGCDRIIVVLTRDRSYVKPPQKMRSVYKRYFKDYPNMISLLDNRHNIYNKSTEFVKSKEKGKELVLIAPSKPIEISRFEKNIEKLDDVYHLGFNDALESMDKVVKLLDV